jgi:hypothetical protein
MLSPTRLTNLNIETNEKQNPGQGFTNSKILSPLITKKSPENYGGFL